MMKIEKITGPDRVGAYRVSFDEGQYIRLYRQTVEDFALYPGKELSQEEFEKLKASAGEMSAKMRAVRIISASGVSKKELQHRLVQKGENPQQAENAVQWLSDMDLLDDGKTACQIVAACVRKGYGVARAKQALYEKRIPKEYWEEALADYPDQQDAICDFLRKRLTGQWTDKQLRKCVDALIRRGHSYADVKRALTVLDQDNEFLEDI